MTPSLPTLSIHGEIFRDSDIGSYETAPGVAICPVDDMIIVATMAEGEYYEYPIPYSDTDYEVKTDLYLQSGDPALITEDGIWHLLSDGIAINIDLINPNAGTTLTAVYTAVITIRNKHTEEILAIGECELHMTSQHT